MKGTLTITRETDIKNLPSDSKKKGFKFELETTAANAERKVNRFKVSKKGSRKKVIKATAPRTFVSAENNRGHWLPRLLEKHAPTHLKGCARYL